MKLAIISHTEHYQDIDGNIVGWGPTISEINHLAKDFEEIYHVAFFYPGPAPPSALPYIQKNIHFVPLKPVGGSGLVNKLKIVASAPTILRVISQTLKKVDVFQFRAPTGMGVFVIPYLTWFGKKKGWFKYAGNWMQKNPSLGYAFQRRFLKIQKRPVTINGKWKDQPKHCLSFENPCLTQTDRELGLEVVRLKEFNPPFCFCFVGRLEDAKGVQRILDSLASWSEKEQIANVHFVGDGEKRDHYIEIAKQRNIPAVFHGFLEREKVFEIYKQAHFFLLPSSASEGFPKVIAEAMSFGCIPIVSNVSSIGQYVNSKNGFILEPCSAEGLQVSLRMALEKDDLKVMANKGHNSVSNFTFAHYRYRIQQEILKK